jgi:regulator of protease activity HflC (stomatin/prohibitin superfamily)
VEVKAIDLPIEMQRAMAKQAEAEREKRAKIISAQGEFEASQKLAEAAKVLGEQKDAITLRYLETMREIATAGNNTTSFFPLPINFLDKLLTK